MESSLQGFVAQSWQWDQFPSFGSLVMVKSHTRELCGLVYHVQTGSMDPVRYPFPYQKTHEELRAEQPQIFEFLKTTFRCVPLGWYERDRLLYGIPPEPPLIHAFVQMAPLDKARQFFASDKYLQVIFALAGSITIGVDELLLASLRYQKEIGTLSESQLPVLMQSFSLATGNDYRRMKLFLQRVETLL